MGAIKATTEKARMAILRAKARDMVQGAQEDLKGVQGAAAAQQKVILQRVIERQLAILEYLQDRL